MKPLESHDYKDRTYLSAIESAKYLGISVKDLHNLVKKGIVPTYMSASGQMRFDLQDLIKTEKKLNILPYKKKKEITQNNIFEVNGTIQQIYIKSPPCLNELIQNIEIKKTLLHFQHELLNKISEELSFLLQQVIDEKKILSLIPDSLDSFFNVCFLLDKIERIPKNINLWIIYLLTYITGKNTLSEIYKIVYCLDFLYTKTKELKTNELHCIISNIKRLIEMIKKCYQSNGSYLSCPKESPFEETRYAIFSINLIEDMIQDLVYNYEVIDLNPIKIIFENLNNPVETYSFIVKNR